MGTTEHQLVGFQRPVMTPCRNSALNPCKVLGSLRASLEEHLATDFCLDIAKINSSQN